MGYFLECIVGSDGKYFWNTNFLEFATFHMLYLQKQLGSPHPRGRCPWSCWSQVNIGRNKIREMTLLRSCSEAGQGGLNEVEEAGDNFWIENVEGGSNQTYLLLRVGICALTTQRLRNSHLGWVALTHCALVGAFSLITSHCVDFRLNLCSFPADAGLQLQIILPPLFRMPRLLEPW